MTIKTLKAYTSHDVISYSSRKRGYARIIPLLMFLTVFPLFSLCQTPPEIGIEGGAGCTSLRGNDLLVTFTDPAAGFSGGFSFGYPFSRLFSLATGIAYEKKELIPPER